MSRTTALLALLGLLWLAGSTRAQATLPAVDEANRERLQRQGQQLLEVLEKLKAPLPSETERSLRGLLADRDAGDAKFTAELQKVLDPQCLVAVSINPESRVKAARGPASAELRRGRERVVLVKVVNEAGSTPALKVTGPQLRSGGDAGLGQWLEARVLTDPPLGKTLTGGRLEYLPLVLVAHEAGKREATLKFDVGQGTQDLGFRAEVPVLFTVR
jgi:hypothetical protein